MPERRCTSCNNLLFMGIIRDGIVEIKCKCGTHNTFKAECRKVLNISPEDRGTRRYTAAR